jgi:hypothetical protein
MEAVVGLWAGNTYFSGKDNFVYNALGPLFVEAITLVFATQSTVHSFLLAS